MYKAFDKFFKLEIMKEDRDEVSDELWIIDEGSMIQENLLTHLLDEVHNQDREPKLHLYKAKLNDLVEDKNFSIKHNRKIILCGIKINYPIYAKAGKYRPALDKSAFEKITKRVKHFDLSELHRHKHSEDIHELAKNLEITYNINDLDIDSFQKRM